MFVLNPDRYLLPDFKISPFQSSDIQFNSSLPLDDSVDAYFSNRFNGREFCYTHNGRRAPFRGLAHYNLKQQDVVTILTTSGNLYVSGCVTREVEKFCRWDRAISPATRIILVIHEFGYPYPDLNDLCSYGLPIIEDLAYAFYSTDEDDSVGNVGEFVIYSFPKMFPIQVGAALIHNGQITAEVEDWPQGGLERYAKNVMSYYLRREEEIINNRISNYKVLANLFSDLGYEERFPLEKGVVPGVFMFQVADRSMDLKKLRDLYFNHGVQCSVFYEEHSFFIPVHQRLTASDLMYFAAIIEYFKE
jgi:hypothetical protein